MKYIILGILGMIISVWLCAISMVYFTETAYELASYITSCIFFTSSIMLIGKGVD